MAVEHDDDVDDEMMIRMKYLCGMVDRRKAFSLVSSRDHLHYRESPTPHDQDFEPAQNLSSGLALSEILTIANLDSGFFKIF